MRISVVLASIAAWFAVVAATSNSTPATTAAPPAGTPAPGGLGATFDATEDDDGIGRIGLTFVFAALVAVIALVIAGLDKCFPPESVADRMFDLTEAERKALAPPKTRYANLAKPGQVAVRVEGPATSRTTAEPLLSQPVSASAAQRPKSQAARDPLLDSLLDGPPVAKAATASASAAARSRKPPPKAPAPDPFMDIDIL
jgi:hypothetical protein